MAKRIKQLSCLLMRYSSDLLQADIPYSNPVYRSSGRSAKPFLHRLASSSVPNHLSLRRSSHHSKKIALFISVLVGVLLSAPAWAYQEVMVNAGGTIKGKVVYHGIVPKRTILPTKDKEVCGGIRKEPKIIVNADNGVQEAVVHLKKVAKGKPWGQLPVKPMIDNKECRFVPHVQVVRKGDIEIVNSDPVLHNTHGFYGKRTAFNVALPNQHQRIKKPLRRPGQVRIECDAHGWMLAWVFVADSPYYTLTNEDGGFTIDNIPPGNYTLVSTQDYTGAVEVPVSVKANSVQNIIVELKR